MAHVASTYICTCLSHKSVLINFVIIEDCRDLHISGIQVDRSRENFIAQIETHAFLQNTKHHIVLYGPLTATNTEADAKLAQSLQEEIMIEEAKTVHLYTRKQVHLYFCFQSMA